jgi:predicted RNA polymerase sigma factor
VPADERVAAAPGHEAAQDEDDTLTLFFLCAHPALSPPSQLALTLRAVGALTTAEIARAFLVPEATIAQRISRAKQGIKASGIPFSLPPEPEREDRLRVVLHVLYLIFNEGYTATSGPDLQRSELTTEAIRLTREVRRLLPDDGEVAGLLALMLFTEARAAARSRADGSLVPLAEQDRGRWNPKLVEEGVALVTDALSRTPLGPYQLQAAIAAVHAEAARAEDTDWPQILALYELLERISPNPMVTLNHAVALAMVRASRRARSVGNARRRRPHREASPASRQSARISWSWPATARPPAPAIGRPHAARAFPNGATSRPEASGSSDYATARPRRRGEKLIGRAGLQREGAARPSG